ASPDSPERAFVPPPVGEKPRRSARRRPGRSCERCDETTAASWEVVAFERSRNLAQPPGFPNGLRETVRTGRRAARNLEPQAILRIKASSDRVGIELRAREELNGPRASCLPCRSVSARDGATEAYREVFTAVRQGRHGARGPRGAPKHRRS